MVTVCHLEFLKFDILMGLSVIISNFVLIGQTVVEWPIFDLSRWRLSAILDFQFRGPVSVIVPNFIQISQPAAEICSIFEI